MQELKSVTSTSLETLSTDNPICVKFFSPSCAPCKAMQPTLEQLNEDFNGKIVELDITAEENADIAARFRIRSVPTLAIVEDNIPMDVLVGAQSKDAVSMFLSRNL